MASVEEEAMSGGCGHGGGPTVPESARRNPGSDFADFEFWGCLASFLLFPALAVVGMLIIWAVALGIHAIA
jgi:hypothetical protein